MAKHFNLSGCNFPQQAFSKGEGPNTNPWPIMPPIPAQPTPHVRGDSDGKQVAINNPDDIPIQGLSHGHLNTQGFNLPPTFPPPPISIPRNCPPPPVPSMPPFCPIPPPIADGGNNMNPSCNRQDQGWNYSHQQFQMQPPISVLPPPIQIQFAAPPLPPTEQFQVLQSDILPESGSSKFPESTMPGFSSSIPPPPITELQSGVFSGGNIDTSLPPPFIFNAGSGSISGNCYSTNDGKQNSSSVISTGVSAGQSVIDAWLQKKGLSKSKVTEEKKRNNNHMALTLKKAQENLRELKKDEQEMESLQNRLEQETNEESKSVLKHRMFDLQRKIGAMKSLVESDGYRQEVAALVAKRRKEREKDRRAKRERRKEKVEEKERWRQTEKEIDTWQAKLKAEELKRKEDLSLKQEADQVMAEVRRKINEGKRMADLASKLRELRQVRKRAGESQGHVSNEQEDQHFEDTISRMEKLVEDQQILYRKEEETLHAMLEVVQGTTTKSPSNVEEKLKYLQAKMDKLEEQWRTALFGKPPDPSCPTWPLYYKLTMAERSLDHLVAVRREWDAFAVSEETPTSSSIPLGWVLPPT